MYLDWCPVFLLRFRFFRAFTLYYDLTLTLIAKMKSIFHRTPSGYFTFRQQRFFMHPRVFVIFRGEISGPLWASPLYFGQGASPIFIVRSGWVSAGSGDPGPTSHFMVFRPSSNALWGTVLTVPKVCKDPTSQNQITSSISYPTSQRIPIRGTTTKTAFGKCRRLFLNNSKLYHFTLISSASCD